MQHKTIIIGGGPAGSSCALYLARFCHDVTLIDAPKDVHGRTAMAPDIINVIGLEKPLRGTEFLERVGKQLDAYPTITRVEEKVTKVEHNDEGGYHVTTTKGTYDAEYLVVAVGFSDNMPNIDGLDEYYDTSIFHCFMCDWYEHKEKPHAIVGNTDNTITSSLVVASMHKPPFLCVIPAEPPTFSDETRQKAADAGITIYDSPIAAVHGKNGYLESVSLQDGQSVPVQVLFTKLGHVRFDQFLDAGDIHPDREPKEHFIKVNFHTFESTIHNLFAIGPCNDGPDQVVIAGGEGAMCATEIHNRILTAKGI